MSDYKVVSTTFSSPEGTVLTEAQLAGYPVDQLVEAGHLEQVADSTPNGTIDTVADTTPPVVAPDVPVAPPEVAPVVAPETPDETVLSQQIAAAEAQAQADQAALEALKNQAATPATE